MPKKPQEKPSLLKRVLVGDVENSPLRKVLGDRPLSAIGDKPISDNSSIWRKLTGGGSNG